MNPSDRVVVTGAGGFIGGHLIADLRRKGFTNLVAVDLKPFSEWYQKFDGVNNICGDLSLLEHCQHCAEGAAVIYNLAADMGGIGYIEANKARCMMSVLINTHLLGCALKTGVRSYFYSSSACVYNADKQDDPHNPSLKEEDAYPALAEDGYGWEKLFSERMCRHFREDYGVDTRVARFHNVYGPNGTWSGGREKAPAAVCRKVAEAIMSRSGRIEIWGDGKQTRSFMYIDDCIEGIHRLMNSDFAGPVNLGSSELVSINQLVDMVEDIAGVKLERSYNPSAPQGVRGRNSDNTLIKQKLGWEPSIPLQVGLEKTYAWVYDQVKAKASGQYVIP